MDPEKQVSQSRFDLRAALEGIIGSKGVVDTEYGGFEIAVKDESNFPWCDTIKLLLDYQQDIWIARKNSTIVIFSKDKGE